MRAGARVNSAERRRVEDTLARQSWPRWSDGGELAARRPRIEDRGGSPPPHPGHSTPAPLPDQFLYRHFPGTEIYLYIHILKQCMVCMLIVHKWNTLFVQYKCFHVLISYYNILPFNMRIPMNFMNITNSSKSPNKCKFPQLTFIVRFKDPFHFKTTSTKVILPQ